MEAFFRMLLFRGGNVRICLQENRTILIDDEIKVKINRDLSAQELSEWIQFQQETFGSTFLQVVILEMCEV